MSDKLKAIKEQCRHISSLRGGYGVSDAIRSLDELVDMAEADLKQKLENKNGELSEVREAFELVKKLHIKACSKFVDTRKQLSEAQADIARLQRLREMEQKTFKQGISEAQIAMQAAALTSVHADYKDVSGADYGPTPSKSILLVETALSATSETVAAWRQELKKEAVAEHQAELLTLLQEADKHAVRLPAGIELLLSNAVEPLRREVAMLRSALQHVDGCPNLIGDEKCGTVIENALTDTQATALAYEREVKAKALENAVSNIETMNAQMKISVPDVVDALQQMAAELRANKGESA